MARCSLILLFFLLPIYALAVAPRAPSGSPHCYTCPPIDDGSFALGPSNNHGTTLFCSYPAVTGGDSTEFYCRYNSGNGQLVKDNDHGLCPGEAVASCYSKRDDNLKAVNRRQNARAAQPSASYPKIIPAREASESKRRSN